MKLIDVVQPANERERLSVLLLNASTEGERRQAILQAEGYLALHPDVGLEDEVSDMVLRGATLGRAPR